MEHDELDKIFRRILIEDSDAPIDINQDSRERIWARLKIHHNEHSISFWKIAAAILFLLFSGSVLYNNSLKNESLAKIATIEKKYFDLKLDFDQSNKTVKTEKVQEISPSVATAVDRSNIPGLSGNEIVEKRKIYITDTIYIEVKSEPERIFVHQRDTIYLKELSEPAGVFGSLAEFTPTKQNSLPSNKKKRPSSVEFVFNAKEDLLDSSKILTDPSLVTAGPSGLKTKNKKVVTFVTFSN